MRGNIIIIVTEKDLGLGTSPVGHRGESLTPYFTNTSHYPQRLSHNTSHLSVFHEVSLQKKNVHFVEASERVTRGADENFRFWKEAGQSLVCVSSRGVTGVHTPIFPVAAHVLTPLGAEASPVAGEWMTVNSILFFSEVTDQFRTALVRCESKALVG